MMAKPVDKDVSAQPHVPVMLREVLESLSPRDGEHYLDGTFGAGGYSRAMLDAADCNVIAIDRDPSAIEVAKQMAADYDGRLIPVGGAFGDMRAHVVEAGVAQVDGIVLDIGVSSMQLDQAARGFSFRADGPLDMRMDTTQPENAADIVNGYEEKALVDLIRSYGEERFAGRIAAAIVRERQQARIENTLQLADIIREVVPRGKKPGEIDPATRTFQALRIVVNDELGELERALEASVHVLKPGGRLVVVTFHSLEDRIVKKFLRDKAGKSGGKSRYLPDMGDAVAPVFDLPVTKAIIAGEDEVAQNSRARSAKLRWAVRTDAGVSS